MNGYLYLQASKRSLPSVASRVDSNQRVNLLNYIPSDVRNNAVKSFSVVRITRSSIRSALVNAVGSAASNLVYASLFHKQRNIAINAVNGPSAHNAALSSPPPS